MTTVRTERLDEHVVLLTLDRPEHLNAMSFELVADLHRALTDVEADRSVRAVVLTGAGRGFCAGFDLKDPGERPGDDEMGRPQASFAPMKDFYGLVEHMRALPQPIVAAVNGPAVGGGFAVALAADIRVAAASARFSVAFIRVGYSGCDIAMSYLLPRLIGGARAAELMLTGRIIDAEESQQIGLVHAVVPDGAVVDEALAVARGVLLNSPFGVAMTKEVMWLNIDAPSLQAAIALEKRTNILTSYTEDHGEAIAAWVEKREPHYRDR